MTAANFALVSIVGSSMPRDVSQVPKEGHASIQRRELPLWLNVANKLPDLSVAFGDYGIVNPNFSLKVPATNANGKIRYTSSQEHHIFRGYCLRDKVGFQQYFDLARRVINDSAFMGRDYSYGDDYLWRCANHEASCGNLGTWVEVDMNHHLVYAAAQQLRIEARVAAGMLASDVESLVQ